MKSAIHTIDMHSLLGVELIHPLCNLARSMGVGIDSSTIITTTSSLSSSNDLTTSSEKDLSLCATLARLDLVSDQKESLHLFPSAAATLFLSDKWEKSIYLPQYEAYMNNEHCIQIALSKLFSTLYTLSTCNLGQFDIDQVIYYE